MSAQVKAVQTAWGDSVPEWVIAMAMECDGSSQSAVARKIGRSPALVNQVLKNTYKGDLKAVEELISGVFLKGTVTCPAFGELPSNECQEWRRKSRKFLNVNSQRVKMFRACRRCPRNQTGARS